MAAKTKAKATEPVEEAEVQDEAVAETAESAETTTRKRRPGPTYGLKPVKGGLPENAKITRTGNTRQIYVELLQGVVDDEDMWGDWFQVAEFSTPTGAKDALKAITKGEREVPGGEWEFEFRRLLNEETNAKYSVLYARYLGAS